jgi:NNP family nitrate/nitrite transporter-like MFS transporter
MHLRGLRDSGHWPTLVSALLYFDVSFMAWVLLGPLALYLAQDFRLSLDQQMAIVATPILCGALFRAPLGLLADRIGPKRAGQLGQLVVIAGLGYVWLVGLRSLWDVQLVGVVLGVAGASFAVALPLAGRWYPPRLQGLVLGIVGAGNAGVVFDSLLVPWLAERFGWQSVFGWALIPVVAAFLVYSWLAKDAPDRGAPTTLAGYRSVFGDRDAWWFMFLYAITFGGFVGLCGVLPLYFTRWYHVSGITAGLMAAIVVLAGAMSRPIGGWLADRLGGVRALQVLLAVVAAAYLLVSGLPEGPTPEAVAMAASKVGGWAIMDLPGIAWAAVGVFFFGTIALGMGNGAVFQLVPLRFRREMGVVTGLVGAAGGLGGFALAKTLGWSVAATGGFSAGFVAFAALGIVGLTGLASVKSRWRTTWGAVSGARV